MFVVENDYLIKESHGRRITTIKVGYEEKYAAALKVGYTRLAALIATGELISTTEAIRVGQEIGLFKKG